MKQRIIYLIGILLFLTVGLVNLGQANEVTKYEVWLGRYLEGSTVTYEFATDVWGINIQNITITSPSEETYSMVYDEDQWSFDKEGGSEILSEFLDGTYRFDVVYKDPKYNETLYVELGGSFPPFPELISLDSEELIWEAWTNPVNPWGIEIEIESEDDDSEHSTWLPYYATYYDIPNGFIKNNMLYNIQLVFISSRYTQGYKASWLITKSTNLGNVPITEFKIWPSDGAAEDYSGYSVSISGGYAIVGAYGDDDNGGDSGSAYIFERSGSSWNQVTKLTAGDGDANDRFGWSVAISGGYAIVGAFGDDDNGGDSGSAYIFERSGSSWNQVAKLTAGDAAAGDWFGESVSISGNYAIVGADLDDDNGVRSGSAYIFERSGSSWNQVAKLTAGDGDANDRFGWSVAISGGYAIVGAFGDDDNGGDSGSAYIFERSGSSWNQVAKLTAGDGDADDWFGLSVSISGGYAIVGAYGDDDNGGDSGSAYIFERSGSSWNQVTKLTAGDGDANDRFGWSVAISGGYAIVGAYRTGSAYIFEKSGYSLVQVAELTASDGADAFGASVSISGNFAIVGAAGDDNNGSNSGSAYIFDLSIPDDIPTDDIPSSIIMPWIPLLLLDD